MMAFCPFILDLNVYEYYEITAINAVVIISTKRL